MSEKTVTPDMTIADILSKFPGKSQRLAQAMTQAGLHCTSCSAATWETLEAGVLGHGFSASSLQKLVDELNSILAEQDDLSTICLTSRAAEKFKEFAVEEGLPGCALRFGDTAGGCGGFQYILDFCEETCNDEDDIFESYGVKIAVAKKATQRLLGSTIDYVDGLHGAGFKVSNPNVKTSCGCGQSQNY